MAVDGNWTITMETPLGERSATLSLTANGTSLTGTMSGEAGTTSIEDGVVNGNALSFKVDITQPMPLTLEFSATVESDEMSGSVKLGMFGKAPLKGRRG